MFFFDGNAANDAITLNSLISTTSDTTPDATTLGDWIGVDDAAVVDWIGITPDNVIDSNRTANQPVIFRSPRLITGGVMFLKNGKPSLDFSLFTQASLKSPTNPAINTGNTFTTLTVSYNNAVAKGVVWGSRNGTNINYIATTNDNRTQKGITEVRGTGSSAFINYLVQENTTNQKLLTTVLTSAKLGTVYYNGDVQEQNDSWSGTYQNGIFYIGVRDSVYGDPLNGGIQEIVIFPSDKTLDLPTLDSDINAYYTIY